jgi:hypothetical protein
VLDELNLTSQITTAALAGGGGEAEGGESCEG